MAINLITITPYNVPWAINENWRRIYQEATFKLPIKGFSQLLGDLDFQGVFTIRGVTPVGYGKSAVTRRPYTSNPNAESP